MRTRKWMALLMAIAMMVTVLAGCGAAKKDIDESGSWSERFGFCREMKVHTGRMIFGRFSIHNKCRWFFRYDLHVVFIPIASLQIMNS